MESLMYFSDVAEGRYGHFKVLPDNDLISCSMREYGEWAQAEVEIMNMFINPGDCVLDVGAPI
jgi:hypothetical protein